MRDVHYARRIGLWIAFLGYGKEAFVAHDVRVGHDSVPMDYETRADTARNLTGTPWRAIIRLLRSSLDSNQTVGHPRGFDG